jgi:hypothetical protein
LTALLHEHVRQFGFAADGRLFRGERNDGEALTKLQLNHRTEMIVQAREAGLGRG